MRVELQSLPICTDFSWSSGSGGISIPKPVPLGCSDSNESSVSASRADGSCDRLYQAVHVRLWAFLEREFRCQQWKLTYGLSYWDQRDILQSFIHVHAASWSTWVHEKRIRVSSDDLCLGSSWRSRVRCVGIGLLCVSFQAVRFHSRVIGCKYPTGRSLYRVCEKWSRVTFAFLASKSLSVFRVGNVRSWACSRHTLKYLYRFHSGKKEAQEQLAKALLMYPSVLSLLLDACKVRTTSGTVINPLENVYALILRIRGLEVGCGKFPLCWCSSIKWRFGIGSCAEHLRHATFTIVEVGKCIGFPLSKCQTCNRQFCLEICVSSDDGAASKPFEIPPSGITRYATLLPRHCVDVSIVLDYTDEVTMLPEDDPIPQQMEQMNQMAVHLPLENIQNGFQDDALSLTGNPLLLFLQSLLPWNVVQTRDN